MSGTPEVKGYRKLTADEIALINEVKAAAETIGLLCTKIEHHNAMAAGVDKRWLAIGRTDLQKGFMAIIRAIAQPTTF